MLFINIKDITLEDVIKLHEQGLNFIIKDGKIKGFTK